jgi:tetratricopeptide (TPR) repeat protein
VKKLWLPIFVFLFPFVLLATSWHGPFILDGESKIEANTDLTTPFEWQNFFFKYDSHRSALRNDPSRPLTYMIYWVCYQIGGGSPVPFHIVNTLLHALIGLLAFLWIRKIATVWGFKNPELSAGLGALLYLSSPLINGTVIYAAGLSDLLSAFFLLWALSVVFQRQGSLVLSGALFALALGAKQSAIVLPALILCIDYFTDYPIKKRIPLLAALAAIAGIYLGIRFYALGGIGDQEALNGVWPWMDYAASEGIVLCKYIFLIFLPASLCIDHDLRPENFSPAEESMAWLAVLILTLLALTRARKNRFQAFALAWVFFLICVLPTSSVFPTVDLMVERRVYFASLGFFAAVGIFVVWGYESWKSLKWALAALAFSAIAGFISLTLERSALFQSPELLWKQSLQLYPKNPRAKMYLGITFAKNEDWPNARQMFEELTVDQPLNSVPFKNLGQIARQTGQPQVANPYFEKAYNLEPQDPMNAFNYGTVQFEKNNMKAAKDLFLISIQGLPNLTAAYLNAAKAALLSGQMQEGALLLQRALEIEPSNSEAKSLLTKIPRTQN